MIYEKDSIPVVEAFFDIVLLIQDEALGTWQPTGYKIWCSRVYNSSLIRRM